jgi:hypothetical protein
MRKILTTHLAALTAILSLSTAAQAAPASPAITTAPDTIRAANNEPRLQQVQYGPNRGGGPGRGGPNRDAFRDRSYIDRHQGHGYYDRNYRNTRRDDGSAIAAGFLGFVLGAAIAGSGNDRTYATSRLNDQSWTSNCARRYRSFDAHSGTYLGNDGYRHYCR